MLFGEPVKLGTQDAHEKDASDTPGVLKLEQGVKTFKIFQFAHTA